MQIVRDLAGYTLGRSDLVRRAMSKKKADVMAKERQNFIYGNKEENVAGCIEKGISEKAAEKIFDDMTDFAKYAFNKSHAASYAVVSYYTGWLKVHYPVEFMAALLTSIMDNSDKVSEYIISCRNMGIELLPPDVNEGYAGFSVSKSKIRYGLAAIKNVGRSTIQSLVKERQKNGDFKSLTDFCERMQSKDINKRSIEGMIKAGTFDSLGGTRKQYMQVYKVILDSVLQNKKNNIEGQLNLFQMMGEATEKEELPDVGEYPEEVYLAYEKEVLGIYLSGHPMAKYEEQWRKNITAVTTDFYMKEDEDDTYKPSKLIDGQEVVVGGIVADKTVKTTRNNKMMAFITLEDMYGSIEVVIFPRDYEKSRELLFEDNKIYIKGRVSVIEDANAKLICQKIISFEDMKYANIKALWLKVEDKKQWDRLKNSIAEILIKHNGNTPVRIYLEAEKSKFQADRNMWVLVNDALINELKELLGEELIVIKK